MTNTHTEVTEVPSRPKRGAEFLAFLLGLAIGVLASALIFNLLTKPRGFGPPPNLELQSATTLYSVSEQTTYQLSSEHTLEGLVPDDPRYSSLTLTVRDGDERITHEQNLPTGESFRVELPDCESSLSLSGPLNSLTVQRAWQLPNCFDWLDSIDPSDTDRTVHVAMSPRGALTRYSLAIGADRHGSDELVKSLLRRDMDPALYLKFFFYGWSFGGTTEICSQQAYPLEFSGLEISRISEPSISLDQGMRTIVLEIVTDGWRYDFCHLSNLLSTSTDVNVILDLENISLQDVEPQPEQWLTAGHLAAEEERDPPAHGSISQRLVWEEGSRQNPFILITFPAKPNIATANPHFRLAALLNALRSGPLGEGLALSTLVLGPLPVLIGATVALATAKPDYLALWQERRTPLLLLAFLWILPLLSTRLFGEQAGELRSSWFWATTVAFCAVLWVVWAAERRRRRANSLPWWVWVIAVPLAAGLIAPILLLGVNNLVPDAIFFALMGTLLLATGLRLGLSVSNPSLHALPSRAMWVFALMIAFLLAFPTPLAAKTFDPLLGWTLDDWGQFFIISGVYMFPLIVLAGLVGVLRQQQVEATPSRSSIVWRTGWVVFSFFLVGLQRGIAPTSEGGLNVIPFAFLLALLVYPLLLTKSEDTLKAESNRIKASQEAEQDIIQKALNFRRAQRLSRKHFEETGASGEDYEQIRRTLNEGFPEGLFLNSPRPTPWENGKLGLARGIWLAAIVSIVYLPAILTEASRNIVTPFYFLYVLAAFVLPLFVKWVLYAFFFGAFYRHIRGSSGLAKGFWLTFGLVLCTVPHDLVANPTRLGATAVLVDVGQTLLFLVLLGVWAFDYEKLRMRGHGLRQLLLLYGALPLAGLGTAVLGSLWSAVSLVLEGQFTTILVTVLELISSPQGRLP